ncbi:non-ribosomal peptide synthetase [Oceanospirillum sediminis]|uniref:Amino acid adenylation domain-containing protein n=1 Tax=Oceanospirillum sediminis TaxID=2760088 RepID=A0A839IKQ0_9GAMM|nr:non-ribosomal peptide synthetase [Oceanospirillum sediminis]MBB1485775.1 amino acid adenylation domain-containing protein [Oceanospirillum sediminis]
MSNMTRAVSQIIDELKAMGVHLWTEDQQLRFKAPVGALTEEYRQIIKQRKQEFIDHLSSDNKDTGIQIDPENRYEPFPLTDLQVAYIVGRRNNYELGGVGCHSYIELELPRLDHERLQQAWHKLILRHDMLRAVIGTDGQQQVLKNVTLPPVISQDLMGQCAEDFDQAVQAVREKMAFRCYDSERWPLYELRLSSHDDKSILHHSTDLLIADFASIQILLAELGDLYDHPDQEFPPLALTFRDILLDSQQARNRPDTQARYQQHKDYWMQRVATLPGAPELPLAQPSSAGLPEKDSSSDSFRRLSLELDKTQWQQLCHLANEHKITPSAVVMNAFTEVLRRWSRQGDFCINLTLLNRPDNHPDVRRVVGDFIAVNVLEVNDQRGNTFIDRTRALQQQLWQDMAHSDFTGIEVLREMTRLNQSNTLIPVVFTSTVGVTGNDLPRNDFMHNARLNYGITQTPQVWLDCQATERREALHIDWDIRTDVFQPGVIEQAFAAFRQLLTILANDSQHWLSTRPVRLPDSTTSLRHQQNNAKNAPLPKGYLHQGFCDHALNQPDSVALICGQHQWSYRQLAVWSLSVADQLKSAGCQPGQPVAVFLDKSPAQIAAIMGILLAGGAYVPIDIIQPEKRRNSIIQDSDTTLIVTDPAHRELNWPENSRCILVDTLVTPADLTESANTDTITTQIRQIVAQGLQADTVNQLAYILYTSGTTGKPKGVMLSHQGVRNTIVGFNRQFGFNSDDRTLALVNYSFDLSVLDIFCTFTAGAALVLPEGQWRSDPGCWARTIQQHKVTVWNSVPAHMQMLMTWHDRESDTDISSLRLAFISGDWIPVTLPPKIRQKLPALNLNSLGGPTEISVTCIYNPIGEVPEHATSIPYGTPFSNHKLYIQNERFEECPDWTPGEMLVGGPGVALGFVNDPERTKERFITHPETGERLYRTGDICRYRADGVIEILGRQDNQIKIRGHRIELGEVEASLNELEYIAQAVALVRPDPVDLVAAIVLNLGYQTSGSSNDEHLTTRIQMDLENVLPGYMMPVAVRTLAEIPLSKNGKVDRTTLKQVFKDQPVHQDSYEAPLDDEIEQKLAAIWQELIQVEQVSRGDDFFMIGGSSLTAVGLLNRLSEEGFVLNIDLIFNNPVFRDMVNALQLAEDEEEAFRQSIRLEDLADHSLRNLDQALPYQPEQDKGPQNIFLTGATGYLGCYILKSLLEQTQDTIYCLIRCNDEENGYFRLQQMAEERGMTLEIDRERVHIIPGDLINDRYGLDDTQYQWLAENIDKVMHIAALISLIAPLSGLYPINVKGSANAIELATTHHVKPVHYMSTIGVHYRLPYDESEPPVPESTSPMAPWHKPELTYEHTKYMAEQLFYMARDKNLPVNIYRSGAITWDDTQQTPYINDDAFVKFFRTCMSVAAYPESRILISTTPVNVVARSIAMISHKAIDQTGKNFHVVSRYSHTGEQIYRWLNELGCQFKAMDFAAWDQQLADSFGRGFINRYFKHGMDQGGHHQYRIDNTEAALAEYGHQPYEIDRNYFIPMVRHFFGEEALKRAGISERTASDDGDQQKPDDVTDNTSTNTSISQVSPA